MTEISCHAKVYIKLIGGLKWQDGSMQSAGNSMALPYATWYHMIHALVRILAILTCIQLHIIWYNMQFICANVSSWMRLPFHKDLPMARLSELFNAPWQKILGFLDPNLQFFDIFRMYCTAIFRMFLEVVGAPLVNSTQLKRFARWTTSSFRKSTLRPCSSQGAVSRP